MRSHPRSTLVLGFVTLALATACTTPLLVAHSSRPLGGQAYEIIGPTQAEACIQSILGIPIATDASLHTTLAEAKKAVGADALIEVSVDRYSLFTGFYNQNCTQVHAVGVRLTGGQAPFLQPGPAAPAVPQAPATPPAVEEPPPAAAPASAEPAKPAEPAAPAKKLTRAERRKLARAEARRKREEAKKKREEAKRQAAEAKRKAAEEKKATELAAEAKAEQEARAAEEAKKKAEEEKRQAKLAKKAAEEAKPVPAEFSIFCKYKPGQPVLVETKAEKIEAEFVKCVHFGVRVKKAGQEPGVIPFETIWSVRMRAPDQAAPASPATPAQPRQ